jgi:hypothetical protein
LLFAGCPTDGLNGLDGTNGIDGVDGIDGKDGLNALDSPLKLTAEGYSVALPNATTSINYILLDVEAGDYTEGTYTLNGTAVTAGTITPVLTTGRMTTLAKIAVPASASGTTFALAVTEDGESVLTKDITFSAAGAAAPAASTVIYGEKFMTFSEYFHDITANIADVRPASTAFSATGYAAEPKKFINAGTRTGNNSAGTANQTLRYTDADLLPRVDTISSATYGDSVHFVPTINLARNYPDTTTKGDTHQITGIKTVEVGVDFDLFANADLLRQAGRAVTTSAAVLAKVGEITAWKASTEVYKAKYLRPDASWGKRDQSAITDAKAVAWPKAIGGDGGATAKVNPGGNWADRTISVDFAPLPASLNAVALWNDYFDHVYAGYVEDLQTGHKEPLIWLQNLFTHLQHTNIEAAIQRTGISRMDSLYPSGDYKLVIFAHGVKDLIVESVHGDAYEGQSSASIEQGSTFLVSGTGAAAEFKNSVGSTIAKELHVTGLSPNALADFDANGGKLLKGAEEVPEANYGLEYEEEDGEIAITLNPEFFTASAQGSYSFTVNAPAGKEYRAIPFTVNRIIARPQVKQGASGTLSDADAVGTALSVTKAGDDIVFSNDDFAKAVTVAGRPGSSIAIESGGGQDETAPAIATVLAATDGVYAIKASALTVGRTYRLTIVTSGFATSTGTSLASVIYYITVQ